jgi:hypothetical protein
MAHLDSALGSQQLNLGAIALSGFAEPISFILLSPSMEWLSFLWPAL